MIKHSLIGVFYAHSISLGSNEGNISILKFEDTRTPKTELCGLVRDNTEQFDAHINLYNLLDNTNCQKSVS